MIEIYEYGCGLIEIRDSAQFQPHLLCIFYYLSCILWRLDVPDF